MGRIASLLNRSLCVTLLSVWVSPALAADAARLDELFERLQAEVLPEWKDVEQEIWSEWAKSGSDTMDLLLERGRKALEDEDYEAAIEHLTALTDHAPDFAEGFHLRATAYFHADLYGPSLADLERALALNPRHFGALAGVGSIMMELGEERRALKVYRRALELHPHRPDFQQAVDTLGPRFGDIEL